MTDNNVQTFGFAQYRKRSNASAEQLLEACLVWQSSFLSQQEGILGHWLLGNLQGEFADLILAKDSTSFQAMAAAHPEHASSRALLEFIDPESIQLRTNQVLGRGFSVPTNFACVEYGTFSPKPGAKIDHHALIEASNRVEDEYLSQHPDSKAHAVAAVGEDVYSELALVSTVASARRICFGYLDSSSCTDLLQLFDPDTTNLDFWYVLA